MVAVVAGMQSFPSRLHVFRGAPFLDAVPQGVGRIFAKLCGPHGH